MTVVETFWLGQGHHLFLIKNVLIYIPFALIHFNVEWTKIGVNFALSVSDKLF